MNRRTGRTEQRLVLWLFSATLLYFASAYLVESVQRELWFGLLFGSMWLVTIIVHSVFIDYLLRSQKL